MATREDCERGYHTADNQGLCWWCGTLVEPEWWEAYAGTPHPDTLTTNTESKTDETSETRNG